MAFTVGWNGNSFASVEYADGRFTDRGVTAWTGTPTAKQGALVRATDYVRALFAARFDPELAGPAVLPDNLLAAVSEYALVELTTPGGLVQNSPTAPAVQEITKEKLGPLETTYRLAESPAPGARKSFPVPDALIASLLLPSVGLSRVYR